MAYQSNAAQSNNNNGNNIPEAKKAEGFLNFWIPSRNGSRKKLGSIPLRKGFTNEMQLANWLKEDPEERVAQLLIILEVDYNSATPAEGSEFDLPV